MFEPTQKEAIANYKDLQVALEVDLPGDLCSALAELGAGYSSRQELLLFGNEDSSRPAIEWNKAVCELGIYPSPKNGGPIFFAENGIGMQYGVRKEGGKDIYIAFDPNTFDAFAIADNASKFMGILLNDVDLIALGGAIYPLLEAHGPLRKGFHLAPFVSPILGGGLDSENWSLSPAKAHMASALAEFRKVNET